MFTIVVLGRADSLREAAEVFIAKTYAGQYGAQLHAFPSRIVALVDERDEVLCAAGLRFAADGFFSESYLDAPVEGVLSALSDRTIKRGEIFEVTTMASRAPRATAGFIASVVAFGESAGFAWSFFTLTHRLHLMVQRMGFALQLLGDADFRRIGDHEHWGSYYATRPKVYAAARARLALSRPRHPWNSQHAHAL
jgi:hypothetical protein